VYKLKEVFSYIKNFYIIAKSAAKTLSKILNDESFFVIALAIAFYW